MCVCARACVCVRQQLLRYLLPPGNAYVHLDAELNALEADELLQVSKKRIWVKGRGGWAGELERFACHDGGWAFAAASGGHL